jgi:choline dehydrogenase-like flavoprotein
MQLTTRQHRALTAIADTFAPGDSDSVPAASSLQVADTVAEFAGRNRRAAERRQLAQVLGLWDSRALGAIGGAGLKRFSSLTQEEREQVLLSWADSRVPQRRALFQALRKAILLLYYAVPSPDGSPSPVWEAIDYPGPLGKLEDAPPPPLSPLRLTRDETISCDVVVVGSGAGGGTAAGVLATAGLDVVVLESGEYYDDRDFDGAELEGIGRLYDPAPQASVEGTVGMLAGSCLGGGTVVNYTTSFRTPDRVREEWAGHGVPAFAGDEYGVSLDAVCERLGVNSEHGAISSRDQKLEDGCRELGWHIDAMPRNVRGCDQGIDCGRCGLGCRLGAKQSTAKTWLVDAAGAGARIFTGVRAKRVLVEDGAARGVEAVAVDGGHTLTVRSRAVVAACGSLHTPALLKRSGLGNANIGRHLRLHPVTVAFGVYDDELRPWEGGMQTRYSTQLSDLDGDNHGVIYETGPANPHLVLGFLPWRSGRAHLELMQALSHTVPLGVLLRDTSEGEVRVGRDGEPIPRYKLNELDVHHVRAGLDGAAQIHEAAGAKRIYSSHAKWVAYDPGARGSRGSFMAGADAAGYGPGQIPFGSFHIMGSARMGGSPATSACRPDGETWDVRDLVVCDGSCFPSASGVNPMISIESIAHMNARGLAGRLSASAPAATVQRDAGAAA